MELPMRRRQGCFTLCCWVRHLSEQLADQNTAYVHTVSSAQQKSFSIITPPSVPFPEEIWKSKTHLGCSFAWSIQHRDCPYLFGITKVMPSYSRQAEQVAMNNQSLVLIFSFLSPCRDPVYHAGIWASLWIYLGLLLYQNLCGCCLHWHK